MEVSSIFFVLAIGPLIKDKDLLGFCNQKVIVGRGFAILPFLSSRVTYEFKYKSFNQSRIVMYDIWL